MKEYRVKIKKTIEVDVWVDASDEDEAKKKAFWWNPNCVEGEYSSPGRYISEGGKVKDDIELYYEDAECVDTDILDCEEVVGEDAKKKEEVL